jgi:hypothetical protein
LEKLNNEFSQAKAGCFERLCPKTPLGKWAVTADFLRIRPFNTGRKSEKVVLPSHRRKHPGVPLGWRFQKPVGMGGRVAAK